MKKIALALLLCLSACATPKKKTAAAHFGSWDKTTTAKQLESELARSEIQHYPVNYRITAVVKTPALIEAETTERNASAPNIAEHEDPLGTARRLSGDKTCFAFTNETSVIEFGYFNNWQAVVQDGSGQSLPITFLRTDGVEGVPQAGRISNTGAFHFWNSTLGCTDKPVDLTKPFRMIVNTRVRDSVQAELFWDHK